jgi:hypothetical protein
VLETVLPSIHHHTTTGDQQRHHHVRHASGRDGASSFTAISHTHSFCERCPEEGNSPQARLSCRRGSETLSSSRGRSCTKVGAVQGVTLVCYTGWDHLELKRGGGQSIYRGICRWRGSHKTRYFCVLGNVVLTLIPYA